jgi:hypothetical protein
MEKLRISVLHSIWNTLNTLISTPEKFGNEEDQTRRYVEAQQYWNLTQKLILDNADMYNRHKGMNLNTDHLTEYKQCERYLQMLDVLYGTKETPG